MSDFGVMVNILIEKITNFIELLKQDYYLQSNEKEEFLKWLQKNVTYTNGVLIIEEELVLTEKQRKTRYTGFTELKALVKEWSRNKVNKQEYWNTLLSNRVTYNNGKFKFH